MSGLKELEQIFNLPEIKLKKAADTRWLSHDAACLALVRVLPAVITSLERAAAERGDALAVGLSKVVKKYDFIACLYLMCDVLPKVSLLSRIFQLSAIDMAELHKHVSTTLDALNQLLNIDGEFLNKLNHDLSSSLASFDISSRASDPKQHFKSTVREPFLTALINNIRERLPNTEFFARFEVLNPLKLSGTAEEAAQSHYGEESVQKLGEHYGSGDTPIVDKEELSTEWFDARIYLISNCSTMSMKDVLTLLAKSDTTISTVNPNFCKLSQIFLTLPVSTADCERTFSTMKRIKTRLRSQMTNNTLNHCMRVSMEGLPLVDFDFDKSIDTWSQLRNRRVTL